ncbi:MAG: NUDIX hydrolase [Acidimicrobiales bacterium]
MAAEPVLKLVRGCSRIRYGAHTLGAAVLVRNPADQVLMVKNRYRRGFGLPGGFCHRGESPLDAAMRELNEETELHLDLSEVRPIVLIDPVYPHVHFLYSTWTDLEPARPRRRLVRLAEVSRSSWFCATDLPPLHRGALDQLQILGVI